MWAAITNLFSGIPGKNQLEETGPETQAKEIQKFLRLGLCQQLVLQAIP